MKVSAKSWALLGIGFLLGAATVTALPALAKPGASPYARLDPFAKVLSYIERSYVDPVSQSDLVDAAIKGMVGSLDPHSAYFTPEEYRDLRREGDGEIVGIGLEIGKRGRHIVVVAPIEGAPADKAGLRAGDVLLAVGGKSTRGWTLKDVVAGIKGAAGTDVRIDVIRPDAGSEDPGLGKELSFVVERKLIVLDAVKRELLDGGVGLVRIRQFQSGVAVDVEAAIEDLADENGGGLPAVIIDLRNNPGGLLTEAVQVTDMFLEKGRIVSTRGRGGQQTESFDASSAATLYDGPVIVLVNRGSASASEIVAAALGQNERAEVVGEATFGKGSVQSIIDLRGGSGLKLTTARYYTPTGASIHGKGVAPDLPVSASKEGDAQLTAALARARELIRDDNK